jgi:hypothetical protein
MALMPTAGPFHGAFMTTFMPLLIMCVCMCTGCVCSPLAVVRPQTVHYLCEPAGAWLVI